MEIMPITEMRNTNKISEICTVNKEPVFITKNGSGHLVIQSHEAYNKEQEELMLYREALKSEKLQLKNENKLIPLNDAVDRLNKKYGL